LAACVQRSPIANLSIIAAGTHNGGGLAQYKLAKVSGLLDALRRDFALIVVDLPAATELRSDFRLTGALDGVVLVIEAERTRIAVAQRVKKELVRAKANLLGLLLNKQTSRVPGWLNRRW
jgi:Mrp family chromosome partitioning ATPase